MERVTIHQLILSALAFCVLLAVAGAQETSANNPDVMTELIGQPFRTSDHGDINNCASIYGGGWWFKEDCARLNLNGDFSADGRGGVWYGVPLDANKIVKMEMKIRPMQES